MSNQLDAFGYEVEVNPTPLTKYDVIGILSTILMNPANKAGDRISAAKIILDSIKDDADDVDILDDACILIKRYGS